ncbi:MAG TPA: hypothetical protein VMZ03_11670 [Chitinophagaceae bacterium]|nr:hypothetical protein [Chitinophagaceae bacterium]
MNINRHNYEEYFILYMDNELDHEGRRVVETFVQQHPDLKEELETLLQYKMTPDTSIVFAGKEELLKENGHSIITAENYEEWITLYIDEELTTDQKKLVERYLTSNPGAQKDLILFQKAKLQPEDIFFANKSSLYRKEEKTRRVFLWRAAAAILVLAFGLSAILMVSKRSNNDKAGVVKTTSPYRQEVQPLKTNTPAPVEENKSAVAPEGKNTALTDPVVAETRNNKITQPGNKANDQSLVNTKIVVVPKNKFPENDPIVIKKEDAVIVENDKATNNLPQPLNNPNTINKPGNTIAINNAADNQKTNSLAKQDVTNKTTSPSEYIQAANINTEELEQPDGKKNKNRGLFRKIARTFEKRTNIDPTDDNKLLVAGLSIKLK